MREPQWSLQLADARKRVALLKRLLSMHHTGINLQEQIFQIGRQIEAHFIHPTTVPECSSKLRSAATELREIIRNHHDHRQQERATQIAALNATGLPRDKAKATVLRQLETAESISSVHRKIKLQMKKSVRESITRVEVPINPSDNPKTCTQWKVVDVPSDVLDVLQKRNRVHFGQAHGSPFPIDPLVGSFGYNGQVVKCYTETSTLIPSPTPV